MVLCYSSVFPSCKCPSCVRVSNPEEHRTVIPDEYLKFDDKGLLCAVIQHCQTGQILMVGYMNRESLDITLREHIACFWSRSRQKLWRKGETSGNVLHVKEIRIDCDGDALLLQCEPVGPTCHTNETSCFYRRVEADGSLVLAGDGVATA
ncbi:MAG: phosphoribosyl-AMP cyclohydrolase [Candidatus Hydrogenedentes bacterium]|nr:phosphoribosyl-AMP cyclohydrolase [Candidatus Hydrogenedentota bacterium]